MIGKGFVTQTAFKKHLDGDWRTVHELWSHIRNYMTTYPAPQATTYTKTEVDAFFEGYSGGKAQVDAGNVVGLIQGSIPFADASGFLTEDNPNLFWAATTGLTLASATLTDDARGLSSIFTLSANPAKSEGIAFYSEGHIGAITTDGPTYGAGIWLNIDAGATLGADVRALDIGIYEAGADCTGGNAYGLAIHMEFDDTNPPAAMYMFRLNTNEAAAHVTPDALIFAANKSALAVTEGDFPFNNYLKIVVQDGTVYRIPLFTEGEDGNICLHSSAELRFYDNGNYVGFEAPALGADQIWILPATDGNNGDALVTDGEGNLSWAPGGNGAVTFIGLTDTPDNYAGSGNKIVKVNAVPDELEFGADIEDLEDVDTLVGQAGKYAKVKALDAGIEWAAVAGNGGGLGRLDIDEDFEGLDIGAIDGQGSYTGWTSWAVVAGANTSAEIVDIGGDYNKILRLARTEGGNQVKCGLDFNDSNNNWGLRSGFYVRFKVRANPDNIESLWFSLRTIAGDAFRFGVRFDPDQTYKFYHAGGVAATLWNTVDNTWYDVGLILFPGYANPYLQIFKDSSYNNAKTCGAAGNNDLNRFNFILTAAGEGAVTYDIAYLKVYNLTMPA